MSREVRILEDASAIARIAAEEFIAAAQQAARTQGRFTVALAGGSTPKALYSLLATDPKFRGALPWNQTYFFFGDERHVPPDHPDSNFRMAQDAMLSRVSLLPQQVDRIKGEYLDAAEAAREYEQTLIDFWGLSMGQFPSFDLVLLGMGSDGHTASLFPGTKAVHEKNRFVVSNWVPKLNTDRITLTAAVLNQAARVLFMVHGEDKAVALSAVLEGPSAPDTFPAQLIQAKSGKVLWLVDKTAARMLATATR